MIQRQLGHVNLGVTSVYAYYVGPDTRPSCTRGTEVVEVSPSEELGRTMEIVTKNMEEMEASA